MNGVSALISVPAMRVARAGEASSWSSGAGAKAPQPLTFNPQSPDAGNSDRSRSSLVLKTDMRISKQFPGLNAFVDRLLDFIAKVLRHAIHLIRNTAAVLAHRDKIGCLTIFGQLRLANGIDLIAEPRQGNNQFGNMGWPD